MLTPDLKFHEHCNSIYKSAHQVASLIFKCFETRSQIFLIKLFMAYVRPKLEYGSQVWNPCYQMDINNLEKVQRSFTKRVPGLCNMTYLERLNILNLPSLKDRRLIADLTMVYKIFV